MDPRPYNFQYRRPRLSNPTYKSDYLHQSVYNHIYSKFQPNVDKIPNNVNSFNNKFINPNNQRQARIEDEIRKIDPYFQSLRAMQGSNSAPKVLKSTQTYIQNKKQSKETAKINQFQINRMDQIQQIKQYNQNVQTPKSININDKKWSRYQHSKLYNPQTQKKETFNMSKYGNKLLQLIPSNSRVNQDLVYTKQQKPYDIISFSPKIIKNTHRIYPKYTLEDKLIQSGLYPSHRSNIQI